jgi:ABC-type lipoprotein release transport system permease subunit
MIQYLKLAVRDLTRNIRRTLLSALALGLGLALLLLMAAVIRGEMRDAMENSIRLQSGHLQIRATSYDEDKTSLEWKDLIENPERIVAQVSTLPEVEVATPRLYANGIVVSGDSSTGVQIVGIDPDSKANTPYLAGMMSGSFITAEDRDGLLIGKSLANKLGLKAGDSMQLLANTSDGDVNEQTFTIRGIFSTKVPSFDDGMILLPLAKAQAITNTSNHASTIFMLLKDRELIDAVSAKIQTSQFKILTWKGMNSLLDQTQALSDAYMSVLYLIVLAVTATVVVNALIMSVFERTREIGILSAIGMRSSSIMAMFLTESAVLALLGIVIGLVLGFLFNLYSTRVGFYIGDMGMSGIALGERIYGYVIAKDMITLTITALVVTLIASLYPAILAARMQPVDALRGGKQY